MRAIVLSAALLLLAACKSGHEASDEEKALAARMNASVAKANAAAHLPFDPAREALVVAMGPERWPDVTTALIREFRVPVVYALDRQAEPPRDVQAYRVVRHPGCRDPGEGAGTWFSIGPLGKAPARCVIWTLERPPARQVIVEPSHVNEKIDGVSTTRRVFTVRRPEGASVRLTVYSYYSQPKTLAAQTIAAALGLKRWQPDDALPGSPEVTKLVSESAALFRGGQRGQLEAMAMDGRDRGGAFRADLADPRDIALRAEALTAQFAQAAAKRPPDVAALMPLAKALARLPDDWQRYGPGLVTAMERAEPLDRWSDILLLRAAELRPAPISLLQKAHRDAPFGTVSEAVCKVGMPARAHFGRPFLHEWRQFNRWRLTSRAQAYVDHGFGFGRYKQCKAEAAAGQPTGSALGRVCWERPRITFGREKMIYLALRRMGLGEEADAAALHRDRERYRSAAAKIGPSSPAAICNADSFEGPLR